MALINCPECSKEVSDKVKDCIHCGYPINEVLEDIDETDKSTVNEPQQVEIASVNIKGPNIKKTIISILLVLSVIIGGLYIYNSMRTQASEIAF